VNTNIVVSEDSIKKAALIYLKSYYRFRPRMGETIAQTDMIASNGVYADGHLSFPDEQGRQFIATFEATSMNTGFEVKFRIERNLLFWDALGVSALLLAFIFSFLFSYKFEFLKTYGGAEILFGLLITFLIINILYRKILEKLPRYRSIFAIERFKQYYADEQWIAIGEDVFPEVEDIHLKELKKQCVYNGFGLITINNEGDVQLHITPAREVVYGKKRKKVPFLSTILENQVAQKAVSWTQSVGDRLPVTESSLLRFSRPFYRQMIMCGLSAVLTIAVFYRYVKITTEKEYVSLEDEKAQLNEDVVHYPEPTDLPDSLHTQPFNEKAKTYADASKEPQPALTQDEFQSKGGNNEDGVYLMSDGLIKFYDCTHLSLEGNNYVIRESIQPDLQAAQKHMQYLRQYGIEANCVWRGCFSRANLDYVVFLDLIYENKKKAESKIEGFRQNFNAKGVEAKLNVISLTNN
jgi:hypothetical protein